MQINLFPFHYPDELHASQGGRYHLASGNSSHLLSYQQMYDAKPFRLTHWIPLHLERFASKLPGNTTINVEKLLRQATLFPLFETFCNARLNLADGAEPIASQITNMPKRIVGESGETHLCTDCVSIDHEEFGQAYIHRSHQIPGVQVCWRHNCRLISRCPNCGCPFERTNELILAPWEPCMGCRLSLADASFYSPKRDASTQEISYANFTRDMLLSAKKLDALNLAAIYKARLIKLGYSRGSRINHVAVVEALENHFGKDSLAQLDVAYRNNKIQQWFRLTHTSSECDVPLPRHLMLTQFLFGNSTEFWKFADQVSMEASKVNISKTSSVLNFETSYEQLALPIEPEGLSNTFISTKKSTRTRVEEILRKNAGWTEDELWKAYPGVMKSLLQNYDDGFVWLKWLIHSMRQEENEMKKLPVETQHPEDKQWAQAFAKTAIDLYSSTKRPMKISRNYLMRAAGWKKVSLPSYAKYTLARQQLEFLCESDWHFYARRILWTKLRAGTTGSSIRGVLGASGIEHHQGLLVLEFFSSVQANQLLSVGTIMNILAEYKISKDWSGPAHEHRFLKPGRTSSRGGVLIGQIHLLS